ncbi:MAG TPA: serine/threonine-protein kinase [Phycisphaerales bacterium]|nr:serine/threonine-protein kinase [Phycisphaerales bacterium]
MQSDDQQRYTRISEIFQAVCDAPHADRNTLLDSHCGEDTSLRSEVEALLRHQDTPAIDLDEHAAELSSFLAEAVSDIGRTTTPPQRIGPYRILRLLGEGGMGVAYLAEQDQPQRTVAIKIIRPGFATPGLIRRFEHEAHVLGRLQHPGIAQIFSVGAADTEFGTQPYIVMEYVDGQPLLDYVRLRNLSTSQRLELFIRICEAIQHAHQRGVIHRDLKPANILVDASGQPKVLDFGVARATDPTVQVTTIAGSAGQIVGTLPYMSPEQVSGNPDAIDTRSDVYSLAVVLYELLTDRLPYTISQQNLSDIARIIRQDSPVPLSSVNRQWRGDLETILATGLEKDGSRRYQSVSEFAHDIACYLRSEPITSRPASRLHRLRKFIARNRAAVFASLVFALTLIAATIISMTLALQLAEQRTLAFEQRDKARDAERRAEKEAERTRLEAAKTERIAAFTEQMISGVDPNIARGKDTELFKIILENAASRVNSDLADTAEIEASLRHMIGNAFSAIADYDAASDHLMRSLELHRAALGDTAPETIASFTSVGRLLTNRGQLAEAMPYFESALAGFLATSDENDPRVLGLLNNLGMLSFRLGQLEGALDYLSRAYEGFRPTTDPNSMEILRLRANIGLILMTLGDLKGSLDHSLAAIDGFSRTLGDDHSFTITLRGNVAWTYQLLGEYEDAERVIRRTLDDKQRVFGEDHVETWYTRATLGMILGERGQYDEAETILRAVREARLRLLTENHPYTIQSAYDLGWLLMLKGELNEAILLLREAHERNESTLGPTHVSTCDAMATLGRALLMNGEPNTARPLVEAAREGHLAALGPDHAAVLRTSITLGQIEAALGRIAEAEHMLTWAAERAEHALHKRHPDRRDVRDSLVSLLLTQAERNPQSDAAARAADWQKRLADE